MPERSIRRVTEDLSSVRITDRLAKVASAFTGGFVSVAYGSDAESHIPKGRISLPHACRPVATGTYEAKGEDDRFEDLTWSFVNHEMGHVDIERKLRIARSRRVKARVTASLFELVPEEIREAGFSRGSGITLPSEFDTDCANKCARASVFAKAYGGNPRAVAAQLHALVVASEDPRQEAVTGSRWKGAGEHLRYGNEFAREGFRAKVLGELARGADRPSFQSFLVVLAEAVQGIETTWAGPVLNAMIEAVRPMIEAYRAANWTDAHGYFDAVNFSLAVLSRVYVAPEPEEEEEEEQGTEDEGDDEDESDTPDDDDSEPEEEEGDTPDSDEEDGDNTDNDESDDDEDERDSRGDEDEGEGSPDESDESDENEPSEDESDEGSDSDDESGEEETDDEGSGEGSEDGDESEGDDEADEGDGTGDGGNPDANDDNEGEDGSEDGEGPGTCEDSGSESPNSDEPGEGGEAGATDPEDDVDGENVEDAEGPLKVGSVIRPHGSETRYKVTAVHPDGSVDAKAIP